MRETTREEMRETDPFEIFTCSAITPLDSTRLVEWIIQLPSFDMAEFREAMTGGDNPLEELVERMGVDIHLGCSVAPPGDGGPAPQQ